ncbi:MAG: hypothetical protein ACK4R2_12680 [Roseateles sp.]
MKAIHKFCLTTALAVASLPTWAALTLTGAGSYNLGTPSSAGATAASTTACGASSGQDALEFTGAGANNIGIHAYACDYGIIDFGSRSSGEGTFFARGVATVTGSLFTNAFDGFSFFIQSGEVGAFGSTAFTAGEFQKSSLTIKLIIDGTTYLDEAWSAEVGAGGVITSSYVSNGTLSVSNSAQSGAGFFSYGINGGFYSLPLSEGDHNIFYEMVSEASGNVTSTSVCTAVLYGGGQGEAAAFAAEVPEGPGHNEPFTSYCGAGARSGDPFNDPIARLQVLQLPEPMSAGLTLTALLAAAGVRRRRSPR